MIQISSKIIWETWVRLESITGDFGGYFYVICIESGTMIKKCKTHNEAVIGLQIWRYKDCKLLNELLSESGWSHKLLSSKKAEESCGCWTICRVQHPRYYYHLNYFYHLSYREHHALNQLLSMLPAMISQWHLIAVAPSCLWRAGEVWIS